MMFVHFPLHTIVTICYILPIACPAPPIRGDIVVVLRRSYLVGFLLHDGVDERPLLALIVIMIRSVCHHLCVEVLESVAHPHPVALGRNAIVVASLDVADSTVATTVTVADSIQRDTKNPKGHGQQELKDAPAESMYHRRRSAAHPDYSDAIVAEVVIVGIDALS